MAKITVVGAGNVGATCAQEMARAELASDIILLDIKEGFAEGKAMDMMQAAGVGQCNTRIKGVTGDYAATAGSDVVVITSGIPRKPGMTREELIGTNAEIVKGVVNNTLKQSPNAVFVIVSNPMDTMTYLALKASKLPKNRIIGMGGMLDSSRFRYYMGQALNVPTSDTQGMVVGGHGDTTMIPLVRYATCSGLPITTLLSEEACGKIAADTMVGGATLTKLIGTSAWYAPGAATSQLVASIVRDQKKCFPCCVYLDGEYGQKDICLGVPIVIGKNGWERIVDVKLNATEKAAFDKSAEAVRSMNSVLAEMKVV